MQSLELAIHPCKRTVLVCIGVPGGFIHLTPILRPRQRLGLTSYLTNVNSLVMWPDLGSRLTPICGRKNYSMQGRRSICRDPGLRSADHSSTDDPRRSSTCPIRIRRSLRDRYKRPNAQGAINDNAPVGCLASTAEIQAGYHYIPMKFKVDFTSPRPFVICIPIWTRVRETVDRDFIGQQNLRCVDFFYASQKRCPNLTFCRLFC